MSSTAATIDFQQTAPALGVIKSTTSITVPVTVLNPTDPDAVALSLPVDQRYISIGVDEIATITWNLDPEGDAFFDVPAIDFFADNTGLLSFTRNSDTSISIEWLNVNPAAQGRSFFYRLHVVIPIGGNLIPIDHDPTVHNDPPTI
jgi:hypothetical protein